MLGTVIACFIGMRVAEVSRIATIPCRAEEVHAPTPGRAVGRNGAIGTVTGPQRRKAETSDDLQRSCGPGHRADAELAGATLSPALRAPRRRDAARVIASCVHQLPHTGGPARRRCHVADGDGRGAYFSILGTGANGCRA